MPKTTEEQAISLSLKDYNNDYGTGWQIGKNWDATGTEFETYINKYLFPKLTETTLVNQNLGNRYNDIAIDTPYIGQYTEEYVFMDTVPVAMNLSKNEELMLKRNYPRIATKLYRNGNVKKVKFTLNNNDVRQNFLTVGDAVSFARGALAKRISDINYTEDLEIKSMLLDYALNVIDNPKQIRTATDMNEVFNEINEAIINMQDNSSNFNEANKASGGTIGRYTTQSKIEDIRILTSDKVKARFLDSRIANTFQAQGLDVSKMIYSYSDLGGVYKLTDDVTVTQESVDYMKAFGDYQVAVGDILEKDIVITYDISGLADFAGKVQEIKPESDLFALVIDMRAIRYHRDTSDMLKQAFYNGEFDEWQYWLHLESNKRVSPFYNKIVIKEG